ncbi:multicopper oxidase domain-containing protein [Streptomyces sp. LN590]|uniref:multicopper oxidase domain-containing protein n=1 Tax=Streptomyces sp. LN590 TaxID=3112980 RepID=UPI00371B5E4B
MANAALPDLAAERYDLIVDFSQMPVGTNVRLTNYHAPVHYPGMPGEGPEIREIMEFRVTKPGGTDTTRPPKELRLPTVAPVKPKPHTRRRQWVTYQHKLFRTMTFNAMPFEAPSQDFIEEGSSEIWEYINPNHDAHPMHVHLVNFQVWTGSRSTRSNTRRITKNGLTVAANRRTCRCWRTIAPVHRSTDSAGPGRSTVQQGHVQVLSGDGDQDHH